MKDKQRNQFLEMCYTCLVVGGMVMKKITLLIVLMFLILLGGCKDDSAYTPLKADEEVTIIVATDLHLLASELHDGGESSKNPYNLKNARVTQYGTEIIQAFVDLVIEKKPTAVLLTGDLTYNGEKASHEELAKMLEKAKEKGIHIFVSPGNHDIRIHRASSFIGDEVSKVETVEAAEFQQIYQDFGWNQSFMQDEKSLSYLVELREGLWLMVLDANQYMYNTDSEIYVDGNFQIETIEWIKECFELAKEKGAKIITSTHQNLLKNEVHRTNRHRIINSEALEGLMVEYGVKINLSGHSHVQTVSSSKYQGQTLYEVVTGALSVAQNNYGFISITPDDVFTYEALSLNVNSWAEKNGILDENLLNYSEYSVKFCQDVSYKDFISRYRKYKMPKKEAELLARFVSELRPHYFSGTLDEIRETAIKSKAYKIALKHKKKSNVNYIIRILAPQKLNQRKLRIEL